MYIFDIYINIEHDIKSSNVIIKCSKSTNTQNIDSATAPPPLVTTLPLWIRPVYIRFFSNEHISA